MKKAIVRTKILIEKIDTQIEKNQGRIKDLAKDNYNLRKTREFLKALPKGTTLTKADLEARDKTERVGKFYDASWHEEQREIARKAKEDAEKKAADEKAALEAPATDEKVGGSI